MSLTIYIDKESVRVTHNLSKMAKHVRLGAGSNKSLYDYTWNYHETNNKEMDIFLAKSPFYMARLLTTFITYMHLKKNLLSKYNHKNCGEYVDLLKFAENLLLLCLKYPNSSIEVYK